MMRRVYLWLMPIWLLASMVPDIRAQQLVANYDFNGNAKDVSGYGNNASIHGAALTQDREVCCLS